MRTFNLNKLKDEFLILTFYHGQMFLDLLKNLDLSSETKAEFETMIHKFLDELCELSGFDRDM